MSKQRRPTKRQQQLIEQVVELVHNGHAAIINGQGVAQALARHWQLVESRNQGYTFAHNPSVDPDAIDVDFQRLKKRVLSNAYIFGDRHAAILAGAEMDDDERRSYRFAYARKYHGYRTAEEAVDSQEDCLRARIWSLANRGVEVFLLELDPIGNEADNQAARWQNEDVKFAGPFAKQEDALSWMSEHGYYEPFYESHPPIAACPYCHDVTVTAREDWNLSPCEHLTSIHCPSSDPPSWTIKPLRGKINISDEGEPWTPPVAKAAKRLLNTALGVLGGLNDTTMPEFRRLLEPLPYGEELWEVLERADTWVDEDETDRSPCKLTSEDFFRLRETVVCLPGDDVIEYTTSSMCSDTIYLSYSSDPYEQVRCARDFTRDEVKSIVAEYCKAAEKLKRKSNRSKARR